MASTPIGHMIFYIAIFIIIMVAMYVLVNAVVTQVAFWILRPSEIAAMDLVGAVTSLGGTTGEVTTDFKIYTENIVYYVKKSEKILCVISQRKQEEPGVTVTGVLTTFNCFSMPFTPQFTFDPSNPMGSSEFSMKLEKWFNPLQSPPVIVQRG